MQGQPKAAGCVRTGRRSAAHTYHGATRSICRVCKRGVEAKVLLRGDGVWLDKLVRDEDEAELARLRTRWAIRS